MKKTIIALFALTGVAFGVDYTTETEWTAQFSNTYKNADGTVKGYTTDLTSPGTFWDAADVATANGAQTKSNKRIHMANGTYGDWSSDFELEVSLTLTGDSITAGHISELKAGSTGDWLCLGVNSSGALTLSGNAITVGTATGTVTTGTEYTLTFTKIGTDLTLACGNASVTATINTTAEGASEYSGVINNITLGGNTGANNRVPVLVSEMKMSSVTVTPTVPEPTTATLSLLALAGLAARRRRK